MVILMVSYNFKDSFIRDRECIKYTYAKIYKYISVKLRLIVKYKKIKKFLYISIITEDEFFYFLFLILYLFIIIIFCFLQNSYK